MVEPVPRWLVIFIRETDPPRLADFADYDAARGYFEALSVSWTGVVLTRVVKNASHSTDEQPPPLAVDGHIGADTGASPEARRRQARHIGGQP